MNSLNQHNSRLVKWARQNGAPSPISQRQLAQMLYPDLSGDDLERKRMGIANYEAGRLKVPETLFAQIERALQLAPNWRSTVLTQPRPSRAGVALRNVPLLAPGRPIRTRWLQEGALGFSNQTELPPGIPAPREEQDEQGAGLPRLVAYDAGHGITLLLRTDLAGAERKLLLIASPDGQISIGMSKQLGQGDSPEGVIVAAWKRSPETGKVLLEYAPEGLGTIELPGLKLGTLVQA